MKICLLCQCVFFATHCQKAIQIITQIVYNIVVVTYLASRGYSKKAQLWVER